jgi:hypothetical protein
MSTYMDHRTAEPEIEDRPHEPAVQSEPVDLIDLIGNTPLIRLHKLGPRNPRVEIYAKQVRS